MKYNEQIFIQTTIEFNDLVRDILFNYKGKKILRYKQFQFISNGKNKEYKENQ